MIYAYEKRSHTYNTFPFVINIVNYLKLDLQINANSCNLFHIFVG